jgi:hypothetical protein
MNKTKYLLAIVALALGSMTFTSCVRNDYYTPTPDPDYGGGNNTDYYTFNEEFTVDNRGWAFSSSTDSAYASVNNGILEFINYSKVGTNTQVVNTNMDYNNNFVIESRIKSDYQMGIIFGNSGNNYEYGYSFVIDNGGWFIVYKEGNVTTNVTVLKEWTQNSAINNNWNKVVIEQRSGYWIFSINGYEVHQMPARPLNGSYCGFILLPETQGYADYLTVNW